LIVLLGIVAAGAAYLSVALARTLQFRRQRVPEPVSTPSITVLKPVYGVERGLYKSLASFCEQRYPDFEVVFCLHEESDPASEIVERVRRAHPNCRTRTVYGDNAAMTNPKIANLAKPGVGPFGEIVAIADSDILVGPEYLQAIAASFTSERTGATTCLYGGVSNHTLVSKLGKLHLEGEYAPSFLVALLIGKLAFCVGATMAVRRAALEAIGGLEALGPHLADDYALGRLVSECGYKVELSRYVVRTMVPETSLAHLWSRERRWARTNFTLAPAGHLFSFVMYPAPFALLYLLLERTPLAAALFVLVAALRIGVHVAGRAAFGNGGRDEPWLIPLRDLFSLAVWAASLVTSRVRWRDRHHRM
jgi:ceramide glucosyltransferase